MEPHPTMCHIYWGSAYWLCIFVEKLRARPNMAGHSTEQMVFTVNTIETCSLCHKLQLITPNNYGVTVDVTSRLRKEGVLEQIKP